MKKAFLILAPILLLLSVATFTLNYFFPEFVSVLWPISNMASSTLVLWTLYLIYTKGTLKYKIWRRFIFIGLGIFMFGALFKLQHWPGADC